jgi:plastocyanin
VTKTLVLASLALFSLGSCTNEVAPGTVEIIGGRRFDPITITVQSGETVTWANVTDETHTVTAYEDKIPEGADYFASGDFDSQEAASSDLTPGLLREGDEYEVTFEVPGTYEYFCIPHEADGMIGTVVVEG